MATKHVRAGNLTLELPVVALPNSPYSIIVFDSLGKTKLIQDLAKEACKVFLKPDVIITPEAKSIPLTQELARLWDIPYFTLRKAQKLYMKEPKHIDVRSITTAGDQKLWYDAKEVAVMPQKNIMIFDDVISSGGTLEALLAFTKENKLTVSSIATIFLEGDSPQVKELCAPYRFDYLGYLPLLETA